MLFPGLENCVRLGVSSSIGRDLHTVLDAEDFLKACELAAEQVKATAGTSKAGKIGVLTPTMEAQIHQLAWEAVTKGPSPAAAAPTAQTA